MKRKTKQRLCAAIIASSLFAGMGTTAQAFCDPMKTMKDASRRAVEAAIQEGAIPPDATIFDCSYSKGADGVTRVVDYRNKDGVWIDLATGKPSENPPEAPDAPGGYRTAQAPTEESLAEYADEVFKLVNKARNEAGREPLERSEYLEEAAQTRAEECASMRSIRYNGQPHTRPDGSRWFTVLGISKNYNYGENAGQGKDTAEAQMKSWLKSEGHRANILREDYTEIGIGAAVSDEGEVFAIQIFSRP